MEMTTQEIQTIYGQTVKALDERELKTAFDALYSLMAGLHFYMFQDELNNLQETYKRLLHYYAEGSGDPMQAKIYDELTASVYKLADKMRLHALTRTSSGLCYYSVRRMFESQPEDIAGLVGIIISSYEANSLKVAESSVTLLFKRIWTSGHLTEEEMTALQTTIDAGRSQEGEQEMSILNCQIVSSLILALQEVFDKRKVLLLTVAAESDDREVKVRAYTGLLIALYLYRHRVGCMPEIGHRLDALAEKPEFRKIIQMIIMRFILSRETEKISNKIRDEIIPEMMKLHPKFNPHTSSGDPYVENSGDEMNPEWRSQLYDSKLEKTMEEFNRLQEEGADVMHSTFVHLKNFPFFSEVSNWFMPFSKGCSLLSEEDAIMKSLGIIMKVGFLCNSDLYSLLFSIKQLPVAGRRMMIAQLDSQLIELREQHTADLQTREDYTERIVRQYVADLYRFHKLYMRCHEFNDIFTLCLDFHNIPALRSYFSDRNDLMNIADIYLHKNYFDDALAVYERLLESSGRNDDTLYQKTGYCKQMCGNYRGALADYFKAEIINPDSKWLLRRIAQCYRALKKIEKAIGYYLQCEKLDPENLSVLLSIGSCYLDIKNYPEALRYYFKADYLDAGSNKTWRPVAWCAFLTGKYDLARNYYGKILSHKPDSQDYMNAGHTEWMLQNVKGALDLYRKSVETEKGGYEKFRVAFDRDIPELAAAGVDVAEIPLILDKLRYSIE
jgi:tetratricopeptide (TPR) repeat protein